MAEPNDPAVRPDPRQVANANRGMGAYATALLVIAAAIAYGSLFPFDFRSGIAAERAPAVVRARWLWTSFSDTLGNVALFVPLGIVGALAARASRRPVVAGAAIVLGALTLSVALQALQLFLPSRSSAVADVLWNAVGLIAGLVAGRAAAPWIATGSGRLDAWDRAILVLLLAWCAGELLPLVPALDWSGVRGAAKLLIDSPRGDLGAIAGGASQVLLVAWMVGNRMGAARAAALLPLGLVALLCARLFIVAPHLTPADPAAYVLGYLLWRAVAIVPKHDRDVAVLGIAFLGYAISALSPFALRPSGAPFGWMPFGAMLEGSMMANTASLLGATFTLSGLLLVARHAGAPPGPLSVILALFVAAFEWAQTWLVGRTSDITPALIALAAGAVLGRLEHPAGGRGHAVDVREAAESVKEARAGPIAAHRGIALVAAVGAALLIAGAIAWALRIPGVPYNVRELFLWDAAFPVIVVFALAVLWVGVGARWGSDRLAAAQRPAWTLPAVTFAQALVSLALLYASVTDESIADIAGSNNLHWFVTNRDIWGTTAREIFLAIGSPALVAFFERPVRYAALYAPLAMFPTVMLGCREAARGNALDGRWLGWTFATAVPTLWLAKAIAFDWSSTDNLNELVARDGPWSLGGGGYLYALVALICASAIVLAARLRSLADLAGRVAFLAMTIPVGWWLLNEGLESRIEKYSHVFSGAQFLLGPDRAHLLDPLTLFARWTAVQLAAVLVIAAGIAIGGMWKRPTDQRPASADSGPYPDPVRRTRNQAA